jgi:hypothetical protein
MLYSKTSDDVMWSSSFLRAIDSHVHIKHMVVFMQVWGGFSITTAYILSLCIRKKTLASTTPRKVSPAFSGPLGIHSATKGCQAACPL